MAFFLTDGPVCLILPGDFHSGIIEQDMDNASPPPVPQEGEFDPRPPRSPVFNLPPALLATLVLLVVIFLVQTLLLPPKAIDWFFFAFGFIPARYVTPLSRQGLEWLWTPVTYSLLHGGVQHIVFNALWLMAFAAPVVRRIGAGRYVLFWILSAIASAFLNAALHWGELTLLIGASGVVSALMGAACRFAFPTDRRGPAMQEAHLNPRLSIMEALRSRMVLMFVLFWFLGNILIAFGVPLIGDGSQAIAWDAHIGGFLFGFLLFAFFDRPPPPVDVDFVDMDVIEPN
jgi:membrane associated rhomboid family serine protease